MIYLLYNPDTRVVYGATTEQPTADDPTVGVLPWPVNIDLAPLYAVTDDGVGIRQSTPDEVAATPELSE